jgi:ATP-binding cassette subfamily B protein
MLLAFYMVCLAVLESLAPLFSKYAIDNFIMPGKLEGLIPFSGVYLVVIVLQMFVIWLFIEIAGRIKTEFCYDVRKKGFKRLQELSFSYYDKTAVGWIMARMTSDTNKLGDIFAWGLVDLVWGTTLMIIMMGMMLFLNVKLALLALTIVPVLIVVSIYFQKKILKSYRLVRKTNSRITGAFNEGITGAHTTKTLVREDDNLEEFCELTNTMYSSSVRAAILSSIYLPLILVLGSVGTGIVLWYGGKGVMMEALSYGTLVAFISYTIQFFGPVFEVARVIAEFQNGQAAAERIMSLVETDPEIKDSKESIKKYGDMMRPRRDSWPEMTGDITFRNVTFKYSGGEKVLDNFSLDIKSGEKIALIGETGSGKSTIVNLACRFYEPTEGEILIDGVEYRKRPQLWLHSNLGYVLQTPHLFSGTVRENIAYGRLTASDEEIKKAAELVNAHQFIEKLEDGYETEVGEGGAKLSTGQKQLVSFARAVLADPAIFVLDEATSSVDTETEKKIQEAIATVLEGRTSFIIAHRLSTIRNADRILVIDGGKVVEEGKHSELLKLKGRYHRLYINQFMDEQGAKVLSDPALET